MKPPRRGNRPEASINPSEAPPVVPSQLDGCGNLSDVFGGGGSLFVFLLIFVMTTMSDFVFFMVLGVPSHRF